jgi:prepilin-type processing-associated H-X9-DG protein
MAASSVKCKANLRSIGQAIAIYTAEKGVVPFGWYDGYVAGPGGGPIPAPGGVNANAIKWPALLINLFSNRYGATYSESASSGGNVARIREALFCPDVPSFDFAPNLTGQTSYLVHPRVMPNVGARYGIGPTPQEVLNSIQNKLYKAGKIRRAAEIAMVFDGSMAFDKDIQKFRAWFDFPTADHLDHGTYHGWWGHTTYMLDGRYGTAGIGGPNTLQPDDSIDMTPQNAPSGAKPAPNTDYVIDSADVLVDSNKGNTLTIRFRHMNNTVANVLMVDGHVEQFTYNPRLPPTHRKVTDFKRKNIHVNPP